MDFLYQKRFAIFSVAKEKKKKGIPAKKNSLYQSNNFRAHFMHNLIQHTAEMPSPLSWGDCMIQYPHYLFFFCSEIDPVALKTVKLYAFPLKEHVTKIRATKNFILAVLLAYAAGKL